MTYLEVTLDVHQKRNIANARNDEQEQGAGKHQACEGGGDDKTGCDKIVTLKVFVQVPPWGLIASGFRQVKGVERQSVDDLTRTVGQEKTLPTYTGMRLPDKV